ncbi:MAG: AAA family ATPase [Cyclobacteriaceae bacterium]
MEEGESGIKRKAYNSLVKWKNSPHRKPLLLRGARQVGKTTLVRQFSNEFSHFAELNLEKKADRELFETEDIGKLVGAILLLKNIPVSNGPLLLFIDEIQEEPKAIQRLRYFHEERPDIHVIAAGSLLEFVLKEVPSFPVGRIEYLYLHPLNFEEYLAAIEQERALEMLNTTPIPEYAQSVLLDQFHEYAVIGGMPEIVSRFKEDRNYSILPTIYNQLWRAYRDDVEKYGKNGTDRKIIRHIIAFAPEEPDRIKMEGFGKSNYRSREVGEALRGLDMARIIRLIYPTTDVKPPISTDLRKRPRLQFLDTGLLNNLLLLQGEMIRMSDMNDLHRGRIAHHLVTQELISIHEEIDYKPHFWVREEKGGGSEVDLVYRFDKWIIPIEVKSGKQGKLRSLHQFIERADHSYAIRMYAGKFNVEKHKTPGGKPYLLMNMPYYLGTKIPEYTEYFVSNHKI